MAVDSAAKRAAAAGAGRPWMRSQVADAAKGAPWRQSAGLGYVHTLGTVPDSAAITGTVITATPTEADIVAGGQTIIITLIGRAFKAAGTGPIGSEADSLVLLSGMVSDGVEATGWNAEVRDKETTAAITRDSNTQATIQLSAAAAYDITANETINIIVPADVMTEGLAIVATPTFDVTFIPVVVPDTGGAGGGGAETRKAFPGRRKRGGDEPTQTTGRNYGPVLEEGESPASLAPSEDTARLAELQALRDELSSDESRVTALGVSLEDIDQQIQALETKLYLLLLLTVD